MFDKVRKAFSWGLIIVVFALPILSSGGCSDMGKPSKYTTIQEAAQKGTLEDLKRLLKRKTDINAKDSSGFTALIYAADRGDLEMVKFLHLFFAMNSSLLLIYGPNYAII